MAATQLLATGNTAAPSDELTVVAGTPATVSLKGVPDGATASVTVEVKDDAGAWQFLDTLKFRAPRMILAPGTYRFVRAAGVTCGVFRA